MTKDEILEQVRVIGTALARQADPSYWPFEDRDRAHYYKARTEAMRQAYAMIRSDANPVRALNLAKKTINNGIEANKINRLIDNIMPHSRREVRDGKW